MWNFVTTRGANLGGRGAKFVGVDILVGGTRGQSHGNSWGGGLYGGSGVSLPTDRERTAVQTYFPVVHAESRVRHTNVMDVQTFTSQLGKTSSGCHVGFLGVYV